MVYFPTWMVDLYGKSPKKRCCQIPEKKTSSRFGQGNLPQKFPVQFRFRKKCIWPYGILQKSIGRKIALTLQPTISVWEFLSSWGVCWSPLEVPSPRQNNHWHLDDFSATKPAENARFLGGWVPTRQHRPLRRRRATFSLWTFWCCRTQWRGCQRCLAAKVNPRGGGVKV